MYRDLVFRPGVDSTTVETMPYNPSVDKSTIETLPYRPSVDEKSQMLLDLFISGMTGSPVAGLPTPMSQEEFHHEVTKRMDRNKPSVVDVLRDKFGVGSFREGINRGIFPGAPQLPGI